MIKLRRTVFFLLLGVTAFGCQSVPKANDAAQPKSFCQISANYEGKIDSLVALMTLDEKVNMLHGTGMFWSGGVKRLGIPEIQYADGPLGIREEIERSSWSPLGWTTDSATFFPAGTALGATWNPELSLQYGEAIGQEARARNKDILLAAAINIMRTPLCGRNYEYFTEDPFLNAQMVVPYVKGVQAQDVAACVKHFAINNQETNRGSIDVLASERAIREIYLPGFKAAVQKGHALSVMGAYNKFRGAWLCENDYLLNQVLKGEWGFKGIVVSDWAAVHNTVNSARNGLDVEMGSIVPFEQFFFANPLLEAVKKGDVDEKLLDEKVKRILRVMYHTKTFNLCRSKGSINTPEHSEVVYKVASEAIVLLKNDGQLLPVNQSGIKSIAIIGDNATSKFAQGGFGAGVKARYEVTPLEGFKNRLGNGIALRYAQGYREKYLPGKNEFFHFGREVDYTVDEALIREAVDIAKSSDYAIVIAGSNRSVESESVDRKDIRLPFAQEALIEAVVKANPKTVVVLIAGAPYDLRLVNETAPAIVWSWFNGSEGGTAIADVVLGNINPSGKLPFTLPKKLEDSPAHAMQAFPGDDKKVAYLEDILVGYRWFDTKNIDPLYCFGHGLSYTTFTYGRAMIDQTEYSPSDTISVSLRLTNSGQKGGAEVVQFYLRDTQPKVAKANKELKGFAKVNLAPAEEQAVQIEIPVADLAYYNEQLQKWEVPPGQYEIQVGSSSRDIRSTVTFIVR